MLNTKLLDLYTDYLLTSWSLVTATGLAELLHPQYSHDRITRFLAQEVYDQRQYWRLIKPLVRQLEQEDGLIIVDDTIEEKPYTDENDIVCWHYDHTTGQNVKGINLINFLYQVERANQPAVSLPLAYEVVSKPDTIVDARTGKTKRKSRITKNALVRERLALLRHHNHVKFAYVVFDSWFSSKDNMTWIRDDLEKHFVGVLKTNRTVALSEVDKRSGHFVQVSSLNMQPNELRVVFLKGISFPVLLTKQVLTNQDGSVGVCYLVTSDIALTAEQLTRLYHKRWTVEVFHKSLKQNAALEKSPTRTVTTQKNHIFAAMLAVVKLETLNIHFRVNHFALKSHLYLRAIQYCFKELQCLQQHAQLSTIQFNINGA